jgi:amphi-Trp domain-containing protein
MSDVQLNEQEHVSRRQAAERLVDLAYALTTGGRLEFTVEGERVTVPLADELRLERNLRSKADHVELKLELSWSPMDAAARPAPLAGSESVYVDRRGQRTLRRLAVRPL